MRAFSQEIHDLAPGIAYYRCACAAWCHVSWWMAPWVFGGGELDYQIT